jgi:hypothetical protein
MGTGVWVIVGLMLMLAGGVIFAFVSQLRRDRAWDKEEEEARRNRAKQAADRARADGFFEDSYDAMSGHKLTREEIEEEIKRRERRAR